MSKPRDLTEAEQEPSPVVMPAEPLKSARAAMWMAWQPKPAPAYVGAEDLPAGALFL